MLESLSADQKCHLLDTGDHDGIPYVVTDTLPGSLSLRSWVASVVIGKAPPPAKPPVQAGAPCADPGEFTRLFPATARSAAQRGAHRDPKHPFAGGANRTAGSGWCAFGGPGRIHATLPCGRQALHPGRAHRDTKHATAGGTDNWRVHPIDAANRPQGLLNSRCPLLRHRRRRQNRPLNRVRSRPCFSPSHSARRPLPERPRRSNPRVFSKGVCRRPSRKMHARVSSPRRCKRRWRPNRTTPSRCPLRRPRRRRESSPDHGRDRASETSRSPARSVARDEQRRSPQSQGEFTRIFEADPMPTGNLAAPGPLQAPLPHGGLATGAFVRQPAFAGSAPPPGSERVYEDNWRALAASRGSSP